MEELFAPQTVAFATFPKGDPSSYRAEGGHGFEGQTVLHRYCYV